MPLSRAQDDLFESSTMTFGQHLEELRRCLFMAIIGLAIGCGIGLIPAISVPVVKFLSDPVEKALTEYYQTAAENKAKSSEQQKVFREAGYTSDAELARIVEIVTNQRVSAEVVLIDPQHLLGQLQVKPDAKLPAPAEENLAANGGLRKLVLFRPIADQPGIHMKSLNPQETFMIYLKASLLVGVVLASPWVFYQIWLFVAAGLYPHERRYVHVFLPLSLALFLAGAGVAYFLAFNKVLAFLLSFNRMMGIDPDLRINEWMSFALLLPLAFGVSFQLPLVMLFLERIGLFTVQTYLASWRMAVLVIFVLAMLLTPTGDPYTMLLMAGPLTALYFGGVVLCKFLPRARSRSA
jgi:sec-independent protein translocase protein TatC